MGSSFFLIAVHRRAHLFYGDDYCMTLKKSHLRQYFRHQRRSLGPVRQYKASCNITYCLQQCSSFKTAKKVAFYHANDGEINVNRCIQLAWKQGKTVYLPVLHPFKAHCLWFAKYQPNTPLKPNRYGIQEPYLKKKLIPAWQLDWVAMPLVAFDHRRHRLGMGGGFYDRTFFLKKSYIKYPVLVGFAHRIQQADRLPRDDWDLYLHQMVTG
jgi:5-formyltetrahydrofolate cyclo-ligase